MDVVGPGKVPLESELAVHDRQGVTSCRRAQRGSSNDLGTTSREPIATLKFDAIPLEEAGRKPGGIRRGHSLYRRRRDPLWTG
jgi:hypothetical protein